MTPEPIPTGYLTTEAILASSDVGETDLSIPEWGGKVRIRGLTLGEQLAIRKAANNDERLVVIHTLATSLVEPRLTLDQAEAMLAKAAVAAQRVLLAINTLNGVPEAGGVPAAIVAAQAAFRPGPDGQGGTGPGAGPGDDTVAVAAVPADG